MTAIYTLGLILVLAAGLVAILLVGEGSGPGDDW